MAVSSALSTCCSTAMTLGSPFTSASLRCGQYIIWRTRVSRMRLVGQLVSGSELRLYRREGVCGFDFSLLLLANWCSGSSRGDRQGRHRVGVIEQPMMQAIERQLKPVGNAQLVVNLTQILLHILHGGVDADGDFLVLHPLGHAGHN